MIVEKTLKKKLYVRRIALRLLLVIYDIIAINVSFILTLYLRFYVAKEMHTGSVVFFERFTHYTPFYSLFCIVIFACFKLYNGMWKYAGFNDLNRIVGANLICAIGHVVGTILFVQRMPSSFYIMGGIIQFILISFARFSFKLMEIEKNVIFGGRKNSDSRAMIIGVDKTTRSLIRRLERENSIYPVCIVDYEIIGMGTLLDGIPVVSGVNNIKEIIKKYNVNYVIFSANSMPHDERQRIRDICLENNIEIQDYYDELGGDASIISYRELIDIIKSNIIFMCNDSIYELNDNMLQDEIERYRVTGISAQNDTIYIDLQNKLNKQLDLSEEWVKEQESKTGEEISFF